MKRTLPILLIAGLCIFTFGCTKRAWRYYPPDSRTLPAHLKPADQTTSPTPTPYPIVSPDVGDKGPALADLQWTSAGDPRFTVSGLPYAGESGGKLQRLPDRAENVVPAQVWRLSRMPSGGRIRFRTDSTAIAVRVAWPSLPNMRNMHAFGQAGIDLYLDGQVRATVAPRKDLEAEGFFVKELDKREREVSLYLPTYLGVQIKEIGLDPGASILPPAPYALAKPVVYYGTSITQGGCASRPGMSYQAQLERRLSVDFVDFGFSGAGKGEPEVIDFVAAVDAACFVMDTAQNNKNAEELQSRYGPALDRIRARHPNTPILCTTPIYMTTEHSTASTERSLPAMREVIRRAVRERQDKGDANLHLIEGYDLLGPSQGDAFVDGVHPNDLGFFWMANALEPRIRALLALPAR